MRITGGELRSRSLRAPRGETTRPTSDRVREALFNILGDSCAGAHVLDLYAGTGALGLEALSRGAARVVFVERGRDALAALRANVQALGVAERASVHPTPVDRAVRALGGAVAAPATRFHLVFADPPYADVTSGAAAASLAGVAALLIPRGEREPLLVLEHAARDAPPALEGLRGQGTRTYGDTALSFYFYAR
jgi:16S rRNA (guanine966-N2)-methyltransferase